MLRNRLPFLALPALFLLFVAGPSLVAYTADWLWYGEVGYRQVFITMLTSQARLFLIVMLASLAWLIPNLLVALRSVGDVRPVFTTREGVRLPLPGRQQLRTIALNVSVVLSLGVGFFASSEWLSWLAWRNAGPFGEVDPVLGLDLGFYVFALPLLELTQTIGQILVVLAALGAAALYLLSGHLTTGLPARLAVAAAPRRHLSLLAAAFFLLLALGAWLRRAGYLLGSAGLIYGPAYADINGRMPAATLLIGVSLAAAALAVVQAYSRRAWPIPAGVMLFLVTSVGGELYGTALQRFVVAPNEQARETPFIRHNIDATRRAFALDTVETSDLSGDAELSVEQIAANGATLDNVRLWDHQPLLDTFGQMQEIRTYYDFVSVDNDRYRIDGELRQVMLSARELNSSSLPNRTWVNERLTFTHGYGLTLGPVNEVTSQGLPVLFVGNLPPETSKGLTVDQPSIYFGELSNDYVIVRTNTREFDYPKGDDNVFTQYDGTGGVPINALWRKALFALRFGSYQILLSNDITDESRIIFHRNVRERARLIAPFLLFDADPYLVLADGRLSWMLDAYTVTDRYPYATPGVRGINYIRNSVKIVMDAYDGTTTLYLADNRDPIAAAYARAFPGLLRPLADMPASLREHVRYPEDLFALQSSVYATYHMTQPAVFYNREDQWEIPSVEDGREARPMQPYYTIMRLPGEAEPEFIQMLPFTPRAKDNLAAWLVARSDGEHYGTLRVFQFPKQKVVFGPRQVVARMNQDQEIAPQITLWNQQGSQVIWGTLMVIPIEESLIYVRPLYLRGEGGRIPELRRVVVAYGNAIVMEDSLDSAIQRIFGGENGAPIEAPAVSLTSAVPAPGPAADATPASLVGLAGEAQRRYDRAIAAQRAGDWATYGEEIRALGDAIQRMHAAEARD